MAHDGVIATDLKFAILKRYDELVVTGTLTLGIRVNDITPILERYIPVGSSFEAGESLLRKCGFTLEPRPGANAAGNRIDRYDVWASSKTMIPNPAFGIFSDVVVELRPKSPQNYDYILSVSAFISMSAI